MTQPAPSDPNPATPPANADETPGGPACSSPLLRVAKVLVPVLAVGVVVTFFLTRPKSLDRSVRERFENQRETMAESMDRFATQEAPATPTTPPTAATPSPPTPRGTQPPAKPAPATPPAEPTKPPPG